jgi:flagellar basal-body rod protein FlgB
MMNPIIGVMSRALDASSLRQKSISNNIANVDTPNYKATKVSFEEMLQKEFSSNFVGNRTDNKHVAIGASGRIPTPVLSKDNTVLKNNGNGVDLDYEMTELSKNTLWYNSLTYSINEEFNLLKTVIQRR